MLDEAARLVEFYQYSRRSAKKSTAKNRGADTRTFRAMNAVITCVMPFRSYETAGNLEVSLGL